jgi:hypothetical protein
MFPHHHTQTTMNPPVVSAQIDQGEQTLESGLTLKHFQALGARNEGGGSDSYSPPLGNDAQRPRGDSTFFVAFGVTWDILNLATAPGRQSNRKPAEPISEAVRFREHDPLKRRVLPRPAHVITLFQPLVRDPRYHRVLGNHWVEG